MRQQQQARQNHGAEGVDVLEGIETDPPKFPGGVIAKPMRDKGVSGFMEGDGDQERQHPDRDGVKGDVWKQMTIPLSSSNPNDAIGCTFQRYLIATIRDAGPQVIGEKRACR
jgi:hypothetical protein